MQATHEDAVLWSHLLHSLLTFRRPMATSDDMRNRGRAHILYLATCHQLLLGYDDFVKRLHADIKYEQLRELLLDHKRSVALSLSEYAEQFPDRNEAMAQAYRRGVCKMA